MFVKEEEKELLANLVYEICVDMKNSTPFQNDPKSQEAVEFSKDEIKRSINSSNYVYVGNLVSDIHTIDDLEEKTRALTDFLYWLNSCVYYVRENTYFDDLISKGYAYISGVDIQDNYLINLTTEGEKAGIRL